jgi:hypothetical protein
MHVFSFLAAAAIDDEGRNKKLEVAEQVGVDSQSWKPRVEVEEKVVFSFQSCDEGREGRADAVD